MLSFVPYKMELFPMKVEEALNCINVIFSEDVIIGFDVQLNLCQQTLFPCRNLYLFLLHQRLQIPSYDRESLEPQ